MARPVKKGLDYFELDCHMEEKVKLIQAEFGLKGFAVVVKLYQRIYGGYGYYCEWNDDSLLLFMSENGLSGDSKNLIEQIVAACIKRDIFSEKLFKKYSILTSGGVQKRYLNATSKRDKVELKKEYLLISVGKNRKNVVINGVSDTETGVSGVRNTQSREEKSREENTPYSCAVPDEPDTAPAVISILLNDKSLYNISESDIEYWSELYPAVNVIQELRNMKGWCDNNPERRKTARGIRRFINSWLAKEQDRGGTKQSSGTQQAVKSSNRFNNFSQRDYDYNEFEKSFVNKGLV